MKLLEEKIRQEGRILPGDVLKVDSFLNHQIDVNLISECGKEWHRLFAEDGVTKLLTIEASGIGIACLTAMHFNVPVVYAKKTKSPPSQDVFTSKVISYTHGQTYNVIVDKRYISPDDRILIIDDFLANGSALKALITIAKQAGATVVGAGIAIEKLYQEGGNEIRRHGVRVESLAKVSSMSIDGGIKFAE